MNPLSYIHTHTHNSLSSLSSLFTLSNMHTLPPCPAAGNVSAAAKLWNEFRIEVVHEAIMQHMFPSFEREVKQRLLHEAKEVALTE